MDCKKIIENGETYLGIELDSTRIKAILIGKDYKPLASGNHTWENRLEDGVWSYDFYGLAQYSSALEYCVHATRTCWTSTTTFVNTEKVLTMGRIISLLAYKSR